MSRCAILISQTNKDEVVEIANSIGILPNASEMVESSVDQSHISDQSVGVSSIDDWGVIFSNPTPFLEKEYTSILSNISEGKRVLFWLTESASGGLWFEVHDNGSLSRKWVEIEGEVAVNMGMKLREEDPTMFTSRSDEDGDRDEWCIFSLFEEMTGISADIIFDSKYDLYRC